MRDKLFLIWLHNRLEQTHGESKHTDYMNKLRSIIDQVDNAQFTTNSCSKTIGDILSEVNEYDKQKLSYKKWIDTASYMDLLRRWRFAENDPIFIGEIGSYYENKINEMRNNLSPGEHAAISKIIGWEK